MGALPSGRNTNRTTLTDNTVTTSYCYDRVDRLTATTDSTVATPAYDTHGNTTTLGTGPGTHTLTYDSSDRHTTTLNGAVTVTYTRDATDRIVARTATSEPTVRYGYTGGGDTPDLTLDTNNNVTERVVGLPGGVTLTERSGNTAVWSYPNVHGDTLTTADQAGTKQGPTLAYDPYGQALTPLPDNNAGNLDYAWLGRHQRPLEHATPLPLVEMGARPYLPGLGRFSQVDPVEGGSANDYEYCYADPVNCTDLDGLSGRTSRKTYEKRKRGLRRQIEKHRRSIRADPNCQEVAGWEREIRENTWRVSTSGFPERETTPNRPFDFRIYVPRWVCTKWG